MNKLNNKYKINYFVFTGLLGILTIFILQDFIFGIFAGCFLALSIWPFFEWLTAKDIKLFKGSISDSAIILTSLFAIIFLSLITYGIFELYSLYSVGDKYLNITTEQIQMPNFINDLPFNDKLAKFWNMYIANSSSILDLANKATEGKLLNVFSYLWNNVVEKSITLIVMIISFYFSLKNGEAVKSQYKNFFNYWIGGQAVRHIDCAVGSLRATMNGVVFIGLLEGVLLSIPMIFGGFTSGFLLAILAGLLGVIPLVLPLIIIPCLGYMYYMGNEFWAIFGLVDLAIVWFMFDNILKPLVIGKTVKINSFMILISMIGGMQLLGILGLLLGPAVVSMTIATVKDVLLNKELLSKNIDEDSN